MKSFNLLLGYAIAWLVFTITIVSLCFVQLGYHVIFALVILLVTSPLILVHWCSWRLVRIDMLFALVLAVMGALWYIYILLDTGPCGQSSCSTVQQVSTVIYNPWGYFPDTFGNTQSNSIDLMRCPRTSCRWADSLGLFPTGYSLQSVILQTYADPGTYATSRRRDYAADRGDGLAQGYFMGVSQVTNIAQCPGHGDQVCARCLQYWRDMGYVDNDPLSCPTSLYENAPQWFCFTCPDPRSNFDIPVVIYCLAIAMILILWVVAFLHRNAADREEKNKAEKEAHKNEA